MREVQAQVDPYAAAWEAHNRERRRAAGPLWIVLGDSMAQGIGASSFDRGWPGQLAEQVDALRAMRMVNLSVYGATASPRRRRQLPALEELTGRPRPALVTVVVGSNDLIGRAAGRPARGARALLARPARRHRRWPASRRVAPAPALQPPPRRRGRGRAVWGGGVPAPGAISWRGKIGRDFFHPNDAGYAAMAGLLEVRRTPSGLATCLVCYPHDAAGPGRENPDPARPDPTRSVQRKNPAHFFAV